MYAAIPGHITHATGQNSLNEHLLHMAERAPEAVRRKYHHTLDFLRRNVRRGMGKRLATPQPIPPRHCQSY